MWIFTRFGFVTAVNARTGDGHPNNPVDSNRIIIRTRIRSHLENLVKAFPYLLEKFTIDEDTQNARDYKYLMFVPKEVWVEVMMQLATDMEYDKFKSSIEDEEYYRQCLQVWNHMLKTQK